MKPRARWILSGVAALAAAALLLPAAADWLVTRDGKRVETDGPWRVEDRLVVFKQPNGTFTSMRLADVDLPASERLTREMAQRAAAPPPAPAQRRPVLRLTERDLPPVGRGAEKPGETETPAGGEEPEAKAQPSLQVLSWREVSEPDGPGLEFVGNVRNITDRMALAVAVTVVLFDEQGEEIRSVEARITSSALPPGQNAGFRASFPGVYQYVRAEFRTRADLVLTSESAREGDAGAADTGDREPPGRTRR